MRARAVGSDIRVGQTIRFPNRGYTPGAGYIRREYWITVEVFEIPEDQPQGSVWIRGRRLANNDRGITVGRKRSWTVDHDCPVEIVEEAA